MHQQSNQRSNIALMIYEGVKQDPLTLLQYNPNTEEYSLNLRSFTLQDGEYSISVCNSEAVNELIARLEEKDSKEFNKLETECLKAVSLLKRQFLNEKSKYETLKRNLQDEHDREMKRYQEAIEENKQYREWYGKLISPILIIKELWNEGSVGELGQCIPPTEWKVGRGLGGKSGSTAKRYWISMLMEWKLIKQWGKGKYTAQVGMYEALEILHTMMSKQGVIPNNIKEFDEKKTE